MLPAPTLDRLCDPGEYGLPEALAAARLLLERDASVLGRLAQSLSEEPPPPPGRAERMLSLFENLAPRGHIAELLPPARFSSSPRIRSKVNKLMAHAIRDFEWATAELQHEDPRISANIVEAMWDCEPDERLLEFFWMAASHQNNRVAGNAVIGLFLLGDERALAKLEEFGESWHSGFRATAAWIIGRIRPVKAFPLLAQLLKDDNPKVRRNAEQSMRRWQLQASRYP